LCRLRKEGAEGPLCVYARPHPPERVGNFVAIVLKFEPQRLNPALEDFQVNPSALFSNRGLQDFLELLDEFFVGGGGFGVG
jgi:hypothetical protein